MLQSRFQTPVLSHGTPSRDVAPFLRSLRCMLDTESPRIVRWTPNGNAFEIHDMAAMTDYVLPKYFKHRKYASFQRQLNYFHFCKWTKSRAVVCTFSNPFYQRDQPALTWRITRKRSLSPTKDQTSCINIKARALLPSPNPQVPKQLDPAATAQTTEQLKAFDGDALLEWIDALYSELDLDLIEDNEPSNTDCFLSPKLLSL